MLIFKYHVQNRICEVKGSDFYRWKRETGVSINQEQNQNEVQETKFCNQAVLLIFCLKI
jgi:hypothetical protein